MKPLSRVQNAVIVAAALVLSVAVYADTRSFAVDGTMLLGDPTTSFLALAANGGEFPISPLGPRRVEHITYPALSRDGQWIATSYVRSLLPMHREGIAVYSVKARRWAGYGDFENILAVSLSPDSSRLAFRTGGSASRLMMLNFAAGSVSMIEDNFQGGQVSWSPDGKSLTYAAAAANSSKSNPRYEVYVLDLTSGTKKQIAEGSDPAWAPSGEWIAYLSNSGDCVLVHPDGSGSNVIVPRRSHWLPSPKRQLVFPPVWSPDSKQLLLNEDANDGTGRVHVHLYSMDARTLEKKADDSVAVLGWSPAR